MFLTDREIQLINNVSKKKYKSIDEIMILSKNEILYLTDLVGNLIGYDSTKGDIDAVGLEADAIISKLLILLEKRGEM